MKEIVIFILDNYVAIIQGALVALGALSAFLGALYGLFLLIPGEQPDNFIKAVWEFTKKWSKKPSDPPAA